MKKQELVFEFMLNHLRLHNKLYFSTFESRTGIEKSQLLLALKKVPQDLITVNKTSLQLNNTGNKFYNDVVEMFL